MLQGKAAMLKLLYAPWPTLAVSAAQALPTGEATNAAASAAAAAPVRTRL